MTKKDIKHFTCQICKKNKGCKLLKTGKILDCRKVKVFIADWGL